jgi:argininosuccinate lyase
MRLTGRIDGTPAQLWHEEVLAPQFDYEAEHLLAFYVAIEKVLLLEYLRMGLVDQAAATRLAGRLDLVTRDRLRADPAGNMSDIAFALERFVLDGAGTAVPAWHVDRSRNDLQACAQLMAARERLLDVAGHLLAFARAAWRRAAGCAEMPMPGYTHLQPAQVVTPGFYLAAVVEETLTVLRRLTVTYAEIDSSPLGSGAMAGQELAWDRDRMARLLGFSRVQPHALVGVASRTWALNLASDLSGYGIVLSRLVTDLMAWGSDAYGFIELPDELSGISSAMPQKKNYPVLERIRGRSTRLAGYAVAIALGHRATPYANTVEVSKEAGANIAPLTDAATSALRLFTAVVEELAFREDRMRAACETSFLGAFTLANLLTMQIGVPWRTAQVIAGRYVADAVKRGRTSADPDEGALRALLADGGYSVEDAAGMLAESFDVDRCLRAKRSPGSAHPDAVRELLAVQGEALDLAEAQWRDRSAAVLASLAGQGRFADAAAGLDLFHDFDRDQEEASWA